ncbi:DUF4097 family beta strand repeat-containing protein [Actinomadura roseirufa]|uniref:DUF4097 family beta strand repeat-containing protein n=1 Tax=Actinomadura roseirufa TaxID=2094049 RepID=UPI0013F167DE|nr:DUF4097 family beta strand repeat-containing protein [Actinomadura roseirufa]
MRTLIGTAVPALLAAVVACAAAGCGLEVGRHKETRTYTAPNGVTALKVRAGTGRVEIVASDSPGIEVREKLTWTNRHNKPKPRHETTDGTLSLSAQCAGSIIGPGGCGIAYHVRVPRSVNVDVENGDGPVSASGNAGTVRLVTRTGAVSASDLRTSALTAESGDGVLRVSGRATTADLRTRTGSITATNLVSDRLNVRTGDGHIRLTGRARTVQLRARSGPIDADGLATDRIVARTGDGDVLLGLTVPPQDVRAVTNTGSVRVRLPRGERYAISLSSRTGHQRIDDALHRDSEAKRRVDLSTGDGDITVTPA